MEETNYDDSNNNNADDDDDNDTINEDHNNAENFDNAHHDNLGHNVHQDQTDFDGFNLRGLRIFDHSIFRVIEVIESSIVVLDANIASLDENMPPEIYQRIAENREMYIRSQNSILTTFMSGVYEMDGDDFEDYDE